MTDPSRQVSMSAKQESPVIVGKIRSAWGLRGDVGVEVLSDVPERFAVGSVLRLKGKPTRVEHARKSKRGITLKLDAANNRSQAEALRGEDLAVLLEQVEPLPDGTYYHFQILGMCVLTDDGEQLGFSQRDHRHRQQRRICRSSRRPARYLDTCAAGCGSGCQP